ncbi:MAG: electron transfer flavoprotein subunit alpha/FixB family protein, partial [Deltaproteobacteria bacterium]|nr:electron transfer flavoprotein subunit alpha/FixB family protein [Deltaproteobacteria bacterium]
MAGSTLTNNTRLNRKILTFVDFPEGDLDDAGKGILSETSRLAKYLGTEWAVVCLSGASDSAMSELARYGVDQVTVLEGPADLSDSLDAQAKTIAAFAAEAGIGILLLPHNDLGGSLAPLLASELNGALFTEAIAYECEATALKLTRQSLGFQVAQSKKWDGENILVLTIHSRILSAVVLPTMQPGQLQVNRWTPRQAIATNASRIVQRIPPDPQTVDVSEAEVIFSVGLGCSDT